MYRSALDAVLHLESHFECVEIFGIEDSGKSGTVDRTLRSHGILAHVARVGHLLGQDYDFRYFFHFLIYKIFMLLPVVTYLKQRIGTLKDTIFS